MTSMKWKKISATATLAVWLAVGCTPQTYRQLEFSVVDSRGEVVAADLYVNGQRVGSVDKQGLLVLRGEWRGGSSVDLLVRPLDPLSPHLPLARSVYLPDPFIILSEKAKIHLGIERMDDSPLPSVEPINQNPTDDLPHGLGDASKSPIPRVSESDLRPEPEKTPTPQSLRKVVTGEIPAAAVVPTSAPTPVSRPTAIAEVVTLPRAGDVAGVQTLTVAVVDGAGRELAGAQVFLGRHRTGTLMFAGKTDSQGAIESKISKAVRIDAVYARHECCGPKLAPFSFSGARDRVRIALSSRPGMGFFLRNYAYGIGRGIEKTELRSGPSLVDVAGSLGLVIGAEDRLQGEVRLQSRLAVPDSVALGHADDNSLFSESYEVSYAGTLQPPRPLVGIWERAEMRDDGQWRRFRREFFSHFMKSPAFRPVVSAEVTRLLNAAGLSDENIAEEGWETSLLNAEIDLLWKVSPSIEKGQVSLVAQDRSGLVLHRLDLSLPASEAPEVKAKEVFDTFLAAMPCEGTLLDSIGKVAQINLGSVHGWNLRVGHRFVIYGFAGAAWREEPVTQMGVATVVAVRDNVSDVELEAAEGKDLSALRAGLRVVRMHTQEEQ